MGCGIFAFACDGAADLWTGFSAMLFGWFYAIPWWAWFVSGLFIGSILGALYGWLAPVSLFTSALVGYFASRNGGKPPSVEPAPETTRQPRRKPRTLQDLWDAR